MNRNQFFASFAGIGLLVVNSTLAQTPAAQPAAPISVPAGSLERVQNAWPARSLIGASVFNDNRQRVATVRDLLLTDDGKVDRVRWAAWQNDRCRIRSVEVCPKPAGRARRDVSYGRRSSRRAQAIWDHASRCDASVTSADGALPAHTMTRVPRLIITSRMHPF